MHQLILTSTGKSSKLHIQEKKITHKPDENQVHIKVHFSGINFADLMMRAGLYPDAPKLPFCPGYEVSGIVESVGSNVTHLKAGDEVMAGSHFGGYASDIILDAWQVFKKPEQLSLEQAASLPVSYITAYAIFFELARVRENDKILIDCATGSLGQISLQILSGLNCKIYGLTSSPEKKQFLVEQGIKAFTHTEFNESKECDFDIVLNSLAGPSINLHYDRLGPCGRIVCIGASSFIEDGARNIFKAIKGLIQMPRKSPVTLMNDNKGIMGLNVLKLFEHPHRISEIMKQMKTFKLCPKVDNIFSFKDSATAYHYLQSKQAKGKVLISWL